MAKIGKGNGKIYFLGGIKWTPNATAARIITNAKNRQPKIVQNRDFTKKSSIVNR